MNEMPLSWVTRPFGELNKFCGVNIDPASYPAERFELYSIPAFPTGKPEQPLGSEVGSTKQIVEHSDVLISKINPRINRVWQVGPSMGLRQIASSEWIGFRSPLMDARFFRYYFTGPFFRDLLCSDVTGVGGSLTRAQPKRVAGFPVPVAPVDEQKRIADKLDTVLTRVDAVNARLASVAPILKRFRQSVLAAATSGRLTEDWRGNRKATYPKLLMAEIADMRLGKMLDKAKNTGVPVPYLRNVNVRWFHFDLADVLELRIEEHERDGLSISNGDLLVCEGGEPGRCAVWQGGKTDLIFQKALHRVRPDASVALSTWIAYVLKHLCDSGEITSFFTGSTIKHLTGTALAKLPIPVPSLDEQTEIVRRVETLFAFADRLEARLQAAQTATQRLTPALLAKAFRGELVPQDPNDEPASELIKRLATANTAPATLKRRGRAPKAA